MRTADTLSVEPHQSAFWTSCVAAAQRGGGGGHLTHTGTTAPLPLGGPRWTSPCSCSLRRTKLTACCEERASKRPSDARMTNSLPVHVGGRRERQSAGAGLRGQGASPYPIHSLEWPHVDNAHVRLCDHDALLRLRQAASGGGGALAPAGRAALRPLQLRVAKGARDTEHAHDAVTAHPSTRRHDARHLVRAARSSVVAREVDGDAAAAEDGTRVADMREVDASQRRSSSSVESRVRAADGSARSPRRDVDRIKRVGSGRVFEAHQRNDSDSTRAVDCDALIDVDVARKGRLERALPVRIAAVTLPHGLLLINLRLVRRRTRVAGGALCSLRADDDSIHLGEGKRERACRVPEEGRLAGEVLVQGARESSHAALPTVAIIDGEEDLRVVAEREASPTSAELRRKKTTHLRLGLIECFKLPSRPAACSQARASEGDGPRDLGGR